jgi:hypothetical protein
MLVNRSCARHAQRLPQGHFVVEASVLLHHHKEIVERVGHTTLAGVDSQLELLVTGVIVDIGARRHIAADAHFFLAHHKAALRPHVVGVRLRIYLQQVIARQQWCHIGIGYRKVIVHIVYQGSLREAVIGNLAFVEAVEEFRVD